jgi:hypothetical protein
VRASSSWILNGDHGLVGERRDQLDLLVGERLRHGLRHKDHADDSSLAQERGTERGPPAANVLSVTPRILRVRQDVGDLNDSGLERGSAGDAVAIHRNRVALEIVPDSRVDLGRMTETGAQRKIPPSR